MEEIANHNGLEHIKLELTVHARDGGSNVVAHNLSANHGQRFTLGGVDLSRHDGRTGFVLRKAELSETATRTRSEVTDILSNLEQRCGKGVQGARCLGDGIMSSQDFKFVGSSLELGSGKLGDLSSNFHVEALECVQASPDSGTTLGEKTEVRKGVLNALNIAVELGNITRKFLTEGKGRSILQVGTTNLDNVVESLNLGLESVTQALQRRKQSALELKDGGNVHNSGERIVGRSGHVDMVVRVNGLLATLLSSKNLNSAVRDDLVGVHVGLGAGTGLPDNEREVIEELAVGNFSGSLLNGLSNLGVCTTY